MAFEIVPRLWQRNEARRHEQFNGRLHKRLERNGDVILGGLARIPLEPICSGETIDLWFRCACDIHVRYAPRTKAGRRVLRPCGRLSAVSNAHASLPFGRVTVALRLVKNNSYAPCD